jgi:putative tryptophan/tyrosine transport system substrate-binding protein
MKRRDFITLLGGGAVAWPLAARAQQVPRVPAIGFLHPGIPDLGSVALDGLREGFRDVGYVEGENIKIEVRWAHGNPEILAQLAKELVQIRVDILIATARPSIEAAIAATKDLPIVVNDLESDPVASGFIASLARPGGNLTGLFLDAPTMCGKWLQYMREIIPTLTNIGILWDATTGTYQLEAIRAAAKTMSIDLSVMEFRDMVGMDKALENGLKQSPQAVIQLGSPLINQAGKRIAETLANSHVAGISQFRSFPVSGGLISYGPDLANMYRRIAPYIFKILHGARPSDLPVERPTKFDLVMNLKAAKILGVTIPPSMLASADEVIE